MLRRTQQRRAILDVFGKVNRPLSPAEVLAHARRQKPGLGLTTVYRAVKDLLEEGALVPVDVPGAPPRYEPAGKGHHHHFVCTSCDSVFEMEGCPGPLLHLAPDGFTVQRHEVLLYGLCKRCAPPPARRTKSAKPLARRGRAR